MKIKYIQKEDQPVYFGDETEQCHVALIYVDTLYTRYRVVRRLSDGIYHLQVRTVRKWESICNSPAKGEIQDKARSLMSYLYETDIVETMGNGRLNMAATVERAVIVATTSSSDVEVSNLTLLINRSLYRKTIKAMTEDQVRSGLSRMSHNYATFCKLDKKGWYGWK